MQCQKQWPYFCRFEDGWPVRDMLASYLVNQRASKALKIKKLKAAGIDMRVSELIMPQMSPMVWGHRL
jgi:hypothetical protein